MKRSEWIAGIVVIQALWTLALIALPIYLLARGDGWGVIFISAAIGVPGLIALIGWFGLRKRRPWGWWLSLILDAVIAAIFIYAVIDDARFGIVDGALIGATFLASIVPLCLVLPRVRKFYWHRTESAQICIHQRKRISNL